MKKEYLFQPNIKKEYSVNTNLVSLKSEEEILYERFLSLKDRISSFGYSELSWFCSLYISKILSSSINKNANALKLITDKDFLTAFDISNVVLIREDINKFNRVYRSYMIDPSNNVLYNKTSAQLLYQIALKLNKKLVDILISIGLNENDSLWIVVNRFSSTDERRNIRRVVRCIQHMNSSLMTEQMVIHIFSKLFSNQFTNLFISVMTDKFDLFDDDNEKYVYSTVSNALLYIFNTMDINDIKDIIIEYENELKQSGSSGRFSLRAINSGDYENVSMVVSELIQSGFNVL